MSRVSSAIALSLVAGLAASPALADAWSTASGRVDGVIQPAGPYDVLVWNTAPEDWLLHAEGEVHHYHPYHTHDYVADSELWNPLGDGIVAAGPVIIDDAGQPQAQVLSVEAAVASAGGPYVDLSTPQNVYSTAHNSPNSQSDALGLGQHDNLFRIEYDGPGDPPESVSVTLALEGQWYLEGDSEPDDYWWSDWFAYAEVYDELGTVLGSDSDYHSLVGPGPASADGATNIAFTLDLEYDTPYAFRFWVSGESHAEAIPEPGTMVLLLANGLFALRRRSHARAADRRHA